MIKDEIKKDLLKDYLENNSDDWIGNFKEVEIHSHHTDNTDIEVEFDHEELDKDSINQTIKVNIWDVMHFMYAIS